MLALLFASVLAGGLICTAEFVFIILTCGPFWMGPGLFLLTWLLYSLPIFIGFLLLHVIFRVIPPLKSLFNHSGRRQFFFVLLTWLIGCSGLVALVAKDFYAGKGYWVLAGVSAFLGLLITLLTIPLWKHPEKTVKRAICLSVILLVIGQGTWLMSDLQHGARVKQRAVSFTAAIPQVCLLVLDTTRGDHFSCNGYGVNTTPNFDRIAAEGMNCRQAISAANWTPPGHISIFTGKYPPQHANNGMAFMPDDLVSLTEILRDQGFYCVALYNNPIAGRSINLTQGFDVDVGVWGNCWVYPAWMRIRDKLLYHDNGSKSTFPMALKTFEWIERKDGHLFLYVNVTEPHSEYLVHEPYFSEFSRDIPRSEIPNMNRLNYLCHTRDLILYDSTKFEGCSAASYDYLRAIYDGEIAYMDEHFGVFADGMRATGLLDQTLLTIAGDHGEFLGEHWTLGHPELMYNPVLNIPLMMRYPSKINPVVRGDYLSNADIFPTVLNLAGLEQYIPSDIEGIDIFSHQGLPDRLMLSANCNQSGGVYSLIRGSSKLMVNADDYLPQYFPYDTLLYDLDRDPDEMADLSIEWPDVCDSMSVHLDDWVSRIKVEATGEIGISEEAVQNLKALGYIH